MEVMIDAEFKGLIPDSTEEERRQLEANIMADGCRDPLAFWQETGILLDGHTRHEICGRTGKGYRTIGISLPDRDAARSWVIRNQLGRRNLTDYQRGVLALQLKPSIKAEAEKRGLSGIKKDSDPSVNLREGRTDATVAKAAGLSEKTVRSIETVEEDAVPSIKQMASEGKVSIDAAAKVAKLPKAEQEKTAANGPKAVKAKAKQIRKPTPATVEPKPDPDAPPWAGFAASIKDVQQQLRNVARELNVVMQFDAATKRTALKWAHFYSHQSTVGAILAIARGLEDPLPAEPSDKPPGFRPVRSVKTETAVAKGR